MKKIAALLLVCFVPTVCFALTPEKGKRRDRARTFLVLRLSDHLDLSDETALQVSAIVRRSDDRRHDLRQQRDLLQKQVRAALDTSPRDDAELKKLIAQANDLDAQLAATREDVYREVQKLLTVEQQAKLVLFRPQLQDQVRGALRRRLEGKGHRRGQD